MTQLHESWKLGAVSFCEGIQDNPFTSVQSSDKKLWYSGYYDAWRILKWGKNPGVDEIEKQLFIDKFVGNRTEELSRCS